MAVEGWNSSQTPSDSPPAALPYRCLAPWVYLLALAIMIIVAVIYIPSYRAEFIWDDDDYILLNPLVTEAGGMVDIWNPTSPLNPQYYPLVFTMFRLEYQLWGLNPLGYHVLNVLLHALAAVLLLLLLTRLGVPAPWFVALLFALHPVCVESVAWITERKNVLCAFFFFLSALSYLRFDERSRYRWFGLSLLWYLLALFSKTTAAALPIGLGLMLWWRRRPLSPSRILTLLVMVGLGFALGMLTRQHEYHHMLTGGSGSTFLQLTFLDRILIAGRAFWFYVGKLLWPADLAFFYSRWPVATGDFLQWLYPLGGVLAAVVLLLLLGRGKIGRGPIAAALFYAVAIFPALGFVNIAFTRYSYVADHFQYIASLGVLLLVAGVWSALAGTARHGWFRSPRYLTMLGVAVVLLGTLSCVSYRRVGVFHDLGTLWADTAKQTPDSWIVQVNYGAWLGQQGRQAEAAACYERAIAISPPPSEAAILGYTNLAAIRFRQGAFEESKQMALNCLTIKHDHAPGLFALGRAAWRLGQLEEAEDVLETLLGLEYDPEKGRASWDIRRRLDDAVVWFILAEAQAGQEKTDEALESYRRACELKPTEPTFHNARLKALYRWDRISEAIAALRLAGEHSEDATPYLMQLGLLLSVAPNAEDRNGPEALEITEALLARIGDQNPHILSVHAAAQAEIGRFEEALATAQRALGIAVNTNDIGIQGRLRSQIDSFSKGEHLYHH